MNTDAKEKAQQNISKQNSAAIKRIIHHDQVRFILGMQNIGLAKKFLRFLSKNKRHIFHFYQPLYWTTYSPKWWWNHFFPLSSAIFQATSLFHLPKTFHLFEQRTAPGDFLQSFRELKFFPLTEFCKDWNKWKSESEMSGEYGGWIRTSQPNCNSVCLVIKETRSLEFPWWKSAFCADLFQTLFFQLV